jgi:hypothetical protein
MLLTALLPLVSGVLAKTPPAALELLAKELSPIETL